MKLSKISVEGSKFLKHKIYATCTKFNKNCSTFLQKKIMKDLR